MIYTYRCGHKKTIKFTNLPSNLPSTSPINKPLSTFTVINQTFNFHCIPVISLKKKHYPSLTQNIMTHIIPNNNICHPLVSHNDLLQSIPPTPHTPPMICLITIKMRIAPTATTAPYIYPFQLRYGYIRSIQVTPPCIHTKQKSKTVKGNYISHKTKNDSETPKRQQKRQPTINNNLPFRDIIQHKHPSTTRFVYQNT